MVSKRLNERYMKKLERFQAEKNYDAEKTRDAKEIVEYCLPELEKNGYNLNEIFTVDRICGGAVNMIEMRTPLKREITGTDLSKYFGQGPNSIRKMQETMAEYTAKMYEEKYDELKKSAIKAN